MFVGFKKGVKCYKIWDPKNKKFALSRDVTFDEASMVKLTNSQPVESEKTKGISQQMESNVISSSLDNTISLESIPAMTQGSDHLAYQDADNDEDQDQAMGNV